MKNVISGTDIFAKVGKNYKGQLNIEGKSEQEKRSGKNYFKPDDSLTSNGITATNVNGKVKLTGTLTATWANISSQFSKTLNAGTYTLSVSKKQTFYIAIKGHYEDDTQFDFAMSNETTFRTITVTKNIKDYWIYIARLTSGDTLDVTLEIQFESGDKQTSWEAYGKSPSIDFPSENKSVSNSVNIKRNNKNLYNYKDISSRSAGFEIDNEGWVTLTCDNTQGSSVKYFNYFTNISKILKPNTDYSIILEIKNVSGEGRLYINSVDKTNITQFPYPSDLGNYFNNLSNNLVKKTIIKTLEDFSNATIMLRSFLMFPIGQSGSITFRISIIQDVNIIPEEFEYVPFISEDIVLPLQKSFKSIGSVKDTFIKQNDKWYEKHFIGRIDSYNSEEINTEYVSTTGELSTGATIDYILEEPELIECNSQQILILDKLNDLILYEGENYFYTTNEIKPNIELIYSKIIEKFDMYLSSNGYFVVPEEGINNLVNILESNIPSMPEATETSVKIAGRDGDIPLNTVYEPMSFEIICYTEDGLSIDKKNEQEQKINRLLNSIKKNTKTFAFEKDNKFYDVKYNGALQKINYPAHLQFTIPLKSSESYAKDITEKTIIGNGREKSDTIENVGAVFTIEGPAQTPKISLNDYIMFYNNVLLEGTKLEINSKNSTITHIKSDGTRTNAMRYYNHEFPKIENGINELKVLSGIDDEKQVNVKWNDLKL